MPLYKNEAASAIEMVKPTVMMDIPKD